MPCRLPISGSSAAATPSHTPIPAAVEPHGWAEAIAPSQARATSVQHLDALYSIYPCYVCGLPVSWRRSRHAAKGPAPAGILVLLNGVGPSSPQRQEAPPKPRNNLMNEMKENFSEKEADAEMTERADQNREGDFINAVTALKR